MIVSVMAATLVYTPSTDACCPSMKEALRDVRFEFLRRLPSLCPWCKTEIEYSYKQIKPEEVKP